MKITKYLTALSLIAAAGAVVYFVSDSRSRDLASVPENAPAQIFEPVEVRYPYVMPAKSSLAVELAKLQISYQDIHELVDTAKPFKNLTRILPGTRFQVTRSTSPENALESIRFRFSPVDILMLKKTENGWTAEKVVKPVDIRVVTYMGTVKTNLWESAREAEMNPALIAELAEVFAWQVDFAREVQVNDRWRISVEQELVNNEVVGLGTILSAEYTNVNQVHTAVLFRKGTEKLGYFAPDGSSLKRIFLKSPIQYGRISSRFQKQRFHPVLKVGRPHLGVDYAAPIGTPIRVVGDGQVTFAGWSGGGGNVIKIRHNSTYETAYKHLSRIGSGIRPGARVSQGQTIGYVGSTGLSTGPHLHFEFFVNGRFVDPLGQKFPNAAPISGSNLALFLEEQKTLLAHLPLWENDQAPDKVVDIK